MFACVSVCVWCGGCNDIEVTEVFCYVPFNSALIEP